MIHQMNLSVSYTCLIYETSFLAILIADSGCSMAHWGLALIHSLTKAINDETTEVLTREKLHENFNSEKPFQINGHSPNSTMFPLPKFPSIW